MRARQAVGTALVVVGTALWTAEVMALLWFSIDATEPDENYASVLLIVFLVGLPIWSLAFGLGLVARSIGRGLQQPPRRDPPDVTQSK